MFNVSPAARVPIPWRERRSVPSSVQGKMALGAVWSVLFINVAQAGLSQGAGLMNAVAPMGTDGEKA